MLYLSGVIIAFFVSFLLLSKRDKSQADYLLVAWMAVTGFHLLAFYLLFTNQYPVYPTIIGLGIPLPLVQGPFLFLFTRLQTSAKRFKIKWLLHFLPVILSYVMFTSFFLLSEEEKAAVFSSKGKGFETKSMINLYAIYTSGIVYVALSLRQLFRYRKSIVHEFSNTEKINFNWLLYLIIWLIIIWITVLFVGKDELVFGAAALFVIWLGYFSIKQVQVFGRPGPAGNTNENATLETGNESAFADTNMNTTTTDQPENQTGLKYQKSLLSDEEASRIHENLKSLMEKEKPFTNPDLTLNELSKSLDVHPNLLSQVINSKENKNFYDLINEKRVQEFIRLISEPMNQQYTLLAISFDCGFNSKASFNRNFKKYTGLTPSDFLKRQLAA